MQEIKKRRIVLASVLKPINDPRMFEKLGLSLASKYEVHIIGYPGNIKYGKSDLILHPLAEFKRLSLYRILAPFIVLKKIWKIKPSLLIICTHELLLISLFAKVLIGCKTIYDVQENYWRNIIYTNTFPLYLKGLIAAYVRIKEWLTAPFINFFLLAEAAYEREFSFFGKRMIVLENKMKRSVIPYVERKSSVDKNIHLLFSGTLAESTGVFSAIDIASSLYKQEPRIRLLIIGYCALSETLDKLKREIADKPFIELTGGDTFVPHDQILSAVQRADFGIIAYPANRSTENSVPTKLYEYLGLQLPVIIINHKPWLAVCKPYNGAVPYDPEHFMPDQALVSMGKMKPPTLPGEGFFWESQEPGLHETIERVLDKQ